jgi:hypothetical protein
MYAAIVSDDSETVSRYFQPRQVYLDTLPSDAPRILSQDPPLCSIAAYFGALKCLQFFLENGLDLFTPDRVFFILPKFIFP